MNNVVKNKGICRGLALATMLSMTSVSTFAEVVSTQDISHAVTMEVERQQLSDLLMRDDVAKQLHAMGVDPEKAQERVAGLTDAEVQKLYADIDGLPAGGDGVGTVLVVLLILILLDVTGVTDIFPKV